MTDQTLPAGSTITIQAGTLKVTIENAEAPLPAPNPPAPPAPEPPEPPTPPDPPVPEPPIIVMPPPGDDLYARWRDTPQWHFGCRMDDADEINRLASRNFGFDGEPYHTIDNGVMRFNFIKGEQAMPLQGQIRFDWSELNPSNADLATVSWMLRFDRRGYTGGKQMQLPNSSDQTNIEHNPLWARDAETWMLVPGTRVYGDGIIGGNGYKDMLSSEPWPSRNVQPALNAPGRNFDYVYARDHVGNDDGRAFLVRPGQWYRYIYTYDWRTEPYRLWLWIEAEDTPRTLVLADPDDHSKGFPLHFSDSRRNTLSRIWFEFNNSRSLNQTDFSVWARDPFVVKGVSGANL